jgi:hypothetical protein
MERAVASEDLIAIGFVVAFSATLLIVTAFLMGWMP